MLDIGWLQVMFMYLKSWLNVLSIMRKSAQVFHLKRPTPSKNMHKK